nr:MAG TPA: hypothetical protein [Caudoviricetes sp.]
MLIGIFNVLDYMLIYCNKPWHHAVSYEILISYNSLYIHIVLQKMVHNWYIKKSLCR